jgi:phosphoglycolate phosphatase
LTPLLVLFDVDGTLFLTPDPLAGRALRETLSKRFGVEVPDDAVDRVDHEGQTSLRIGRLVLRDARLDDGKIDGGLHAWCSDFARRYLELLHDADTSAWIAAPRAEAALERLERSGHRLALLTGNPEPVARARLERLGLARFFPTGQGAFGCESESRGELIALARARAGDWPADRTLEVGDTAVDVSSAREAGIRSLRVGQGAGLADALAELG